MRSRMWNIQRRKPSSLSLVCDLSDRQLVIFDSFAGLPEPRPDDRSHLVLDRREIHTYQKGDWSGTLEEVKQTISRYGRLSRCEFQVGYFGETLPQFRQPCVAAFLDVDLAGSTETCLRYLWPLLQDGGFMFTHDALHAEISGLFFDKEWWETNLNQAPPGLVGAGNGLGLVPKAGGSQARSATQSRTRRAFSLRESAETGNI